MVHQVEAEKILLSTWMEKELSKWFSEQGRQYLPQAILWF